MHKLAVALVTLLALLAPAALAQSGTLEAGDPTLDSGEYFDVYERWLDAGATVSIAITSTEVDPYLMVLEPDDSADFQVDDSPGEGLNVRTDFTAEASGVHLIVVTSARPGETGRYLLSITEPAPGSPPGGQARNPLAPAPADPFAGTFESQELTLVLEPAAPGRYSGRILFNGVTMPLAASVQGGSLAGSFRSNGSDFPFSAGFEGSRLRFETSGAVYLLDRSEAADGPSNPLQPAAEAPANPLRPASSPADPPSGARLFVPTPAVAPAIPQVAPEPGYIQGVVVDARGGPIQGALVAVYGTTIAGANTRFETSTGADGSYRQRVPDGIYGVSAYVKTSYAGDHFELTIPALDGDTGVELDAADGGVENFVWYLEGLRAPHLSTEDAYSYHGLHLRVQGATAFEAAPHLADNTLEVLFTPSGPLMDGSAGRPLVYRYPLGNGEDVTGPTWGGGVDFHTDLLDIPLGSYSVSARLIAPGGNATPLRIGTACCSVEDLSSSFLLEPVPYSITRTPQPFPTLYVAP